jgi:hypothetical protein
MIFRQIKFWMTLDKIEAGASVSTNFVKYSATTNMYFFCRTVVGKESSMSMSHKLKGHASGIEIISYGRIRDILLFNWHFSHLRTKAVASDFMVG